MGFFSLLRISIFLRLTPWISSQFYHDLPGIFHCFALIPLEILVFPSNFDIPLWNSNYFHSTPLKFLLISSTGGFQFFFLEKPNFIAQNWWSEERWRIVFKSNRLFVLDNDNDVIQIGAPCKRNGCDCVSFFIMLILLLLDRFIAQIFQIIFQKKKIHVFNLF